MLFRATDLNRIVQAYGRDLTLRSKSTGTYDPSTGGLTGGSNTDYTVKIYLFDYRLDEIDGTEVVAGDRRAVILSTDTSGDAIPEPEVNDEIRGAGDTVSIVRTSKIYSGTDVICYLSQVRE